MNFPVQLDELIVGIFTGGLYFNTRAKACKETWLSAVPHWYLFSSGSDADLPVVSVGDVGDDWNSCTAKQMLGLCHMWEEHPEAKWFFLCGCDTFGYPRNMADCLSAWDPEEPVLVGGKLIDPKYIPLDRLPGMPALFYPPGGAGHALSRGLVKILYPQMKKFLERWQTQTPSFFIGAADYALAVMAFEEAGITSQVGTGFFHQSPTSLYAFSLRLPDAINLVSLHYMQPPRMYFFFRHPILSRSLLLLRAAANEVVHGISKLLQCVGISRGQLEKVRARFSTT